MFVCPECGLAQVQGGACPADGTALAAPTDDPIVGTTVGVYRIARLLGVGGMGRVYKGVHPQIGSRVAVKVLSRECSDRPELVERFFSEARAVNLIRHESIVNVLDLSRLPDGRPYIIMEYLDGAPLNDIVAQVGPLPLGGLARLAAEVLDALGAAHAKGIVHRDLKPDNIFVTPAGHPKVLDFGIAKLRPEMGGSFTQTGSLLGTPHYMSPEQAMGKPVDHRTDLYAMGVILFECATGRKPFEADSLFDLLRKHVDQPPPMPRALRPDIPPALEQVILTTLAKDPNQRFGSAGALAQALQAATAGLGPEAWVPISPSTAQRISAQRTPMPSGGGMTPSSWPQGWAPTHPQGMPPGSSPPGMMPGTPPPGGATATSGQVVPKPVGSSKKGLWIGLGAIALIGVIVVIAVAAGGGGDSGGGGGGGSTAASGGGSSSGGSSSASAGSGKASSGSSASGTQIASAGSGKASSGSSGSSGGQVASSGGGSSGSSGGQVASSGGGSSGSSGGQVASSGGGSSGGGSASDNDTPPPDDYHGGPLPMPSGQTAKKFDFIAFYPAAEAEAKKIWPDAKLWRIDAQGVYPDGNADVTLAENWEVMYRFISPKHSEPPAGTPMGVKKDENCVIYVDVEPTGIRSHVWSWDCKEEKLIRAPRCSAQQVWAKAIKLGAPAKNAVAELGYRSDFDGNVLWYFDIGDNFSQTIPDDCR